MRPDAANESGKMSGWAGIAKTLAVCAVVMTVVPFAARIAMDRLSDGKAPSPQNASEKIQALLGDSRTPAERAMDLVRKPKSRWTKSEIERERPLYGWLETQSKTVLPWEWTQTARGKDAVGYGKVWIGLFEDIEDAFGDELKAVRRRLGKRRADIGEWGSLAEGVSNQLERLQAALSTNGVPTSMTVETVRRGWLWGYNRTKKTEILATTDDLRRAVVAESARLKDCREQLTGMRTEASVDEKRQDELEPALAKATAAADELKGLVRSADFSARAVTAEFEAKYLEMLVDLIRLMRTGNR